ncbi:hypothetical protein Pfo_025299 [Paulownia fortunei]|nr:hypothetical protein Pfo_025299 [Paulownia fortunei]
MEAQQRAQAHIAMLSSPGMGHLFPLIELARKLLQLHSFTITFIILDDGSPVNPPKALLETFPAINTIFLPPASGDDLPEDANAGTRIAHTVIRSVPALRQVLSELKESSRLSAFVVDLFGVFTFDVVKELGIPLYLFYTSTAIALSFSLYIPFLDLEPDTFKAFEQGGFRTTPPVYPVGPLIRTGSTNESCDDKPECLKWLDKQPAGSVLFVSFGSGGTLSREQLKELASAHIIRLEMQHILQMTKEKGFVLSQWAPQIEVLSHRAVGGFLTHCGWNSTLESIVHGVPLIPWPLYAEQRMNAVFLSEELKVALRVRENENGVVDSEQISRLARRLMEGEEGEQLRIRMRNLKDAAARAFSQDGSSTKSLANVAQKWIGK